MRHARCRAAWLCGALLGALLAGCASQHTDGPGTSAAAIRFRDVSVSAGVKFTRVNGAFGKRWMPETMGGGGAFLDYDNDGFLDILLLNGDWWPGHPLPGPRPTLTLYHNNQDGTFTDTTQAMGLKVSLQGMGAAVGDYDNDGYEDLYVTGVGGNRLFHNEGGKRFVEVTGQAGVGDGGWSTSAAWLDYDNDGKLDLFVCHYIRWTPKTDIYCGTVEKAYCRPQSYPGETCHLFHNEGRGRFRDVTRSAGIWNKNAKALGVCVCDLDGDNRPDLIVANDTEPNFVFRNTGHGKFTEIGYKTGLAFDENGKARAGMGIDAADVKNDGTLAVAIGNFCFEGIAFYQIDPASLSAEWVKQNGLFEPSYPYVTFGLFFADFDNDGRADLFITNGHIQDTITHANTGQTYEQPSVLFRNQGSGAFQDISHAAGPGITQPLVGRGACRGDYDNDGRIDILLIPNVGPARLLHNETPGRNHWLTVKLVGTRSNRDGYGARVMVEAAGERQTAYAHSGSSYLSANDPRLHFGLGEARQADRVTVRWPSGLEEIWRAIPADQVVTLTEGHAAGS